MTTPNSVQASCCAKWPACTRGPSGWWRTVAAHQHQCHLLTELGRTGPLPLSEIGTRVLVGKELGVTSGGCHGGARTGDERRQPGRRTQLAGHPDAGRLAHPWRTQPHAGRHAETLLASLNPRERAAVENSLLILMKALRDDTAANCCLPRLRERTPSHAAEPERLAAPAGTADWPAIERLLLANKLPIQGARDHLATYLLAVSNGEVVGSAGAEVYGDIALLRSVAVAPGLHRQGIGQLLVTRLIGRPSGRQIRELYLLTVTAPEYFAQYGFKRGAHRTGAGGAEGIRGVAGCVPGLRGLHVAAAGGACFVAGRLARGRHRRRPRGPGGRGSIDRARHGAHRAGGRPFGGRPAWWTTATCACSRPGATTSTLPWQPSSHRPVGRHPIQSSCHWPARSSSACSSPYAALPRVARALRLNTRVLAISREGFDKVKTAGREAAPFVIRAQQDGQHVEVRARAVIDASGTWSTPNPLGANGLPALGEKDNAESIFYGIPRRARARPRALRRPTHPGGGRRALGSQRAAGPGRSGCRVAAYPLRLGCAFADAGACFRWWRCRCLAGARTAGRIAEGTARQRPHGVRQRPAHRIRPARRRDADRRGPRARPAAPGPDGHRPDRLRHGPASRSCDGG